MLLLFSYILPYDNQIFASFESNCSFSLFERPKHTSKNQALLTINVCSRVRRIHKLVWKSSLVVFFSLSLSLRSLLLCFVLSCCCFVFFIHFSFSFHRESVYFVSGSIAISFLYDFGPRNQMKTVSKRWKIWCSRCQTNKIEIELSTYEQIKRVYYCCFDLNAFTSKGRPNYTQ